MSSKKLVILIDGLYYAYSAYYALPRLFNSLGEPTWVIYGFINTLRSIYIKYHPFYMIVVFDVNGSTFRNNLFKEYKLHRKPMPVDLYIQIPAICEIIKAMGFSVVSLIGIEADDIIGTLSMLFSQRSKYCVYIFSGDKDMMQLVSSSVYVVDTRFNKFFTVDEVKKKFGVLPNLIVDYLSLLGDVSDNIPGVPGIGKVTANILLQKFSDLNMLYRNLDKVASLIGLRRAKSVSLRLEKYRFLAFLSYQLVTIKRDVILDVSDHDLLVQSLDIDKLMFFFIRYDFKKWVKALYSGQWLKSF